MTLPSPAAALDRHQQKRETGLPTISVLSGTVELALQLARRWAEDRRRPVVQWDGLAQDGMVDAWVAGLATGRDLVQDSLAWLALRLGRRFEELGPRVGRMTPFELAAFLESGLAAPDGPGAACRWLLERWVAGEPIAAPGLAAQLGAAMADPDGDGPGERVIAALGELIPPGSGPILLLARPADGRASAAWVESAARGLARLVVAHPRLTPILAVAPDDLDAFERLAPESRAKALVRAGVITVGGLNRADTGRLMAADGASEGLVGLSLDAARATTTPERAGLEDDDPARSAAERFLFERLESLPETAGLFALNATLDFRFGSSAMEVDLASRVLGLAIEIDGYYHFQDADAYRRDRRKDFELQRRGYLVVRVLAEDVVPRLEEVLDLILMAVASRRDRRRGETP